MVKKDTIINAVGYRGFTIGEAFTGPSQMNDQVKQTVEDVSTLILGKNAYRVLKKAEQGLQSAVSVAKSTIVIRSVVIPVANFSSNVIQLLSYNISPRQIGPVTYLCRSRVSTAASALATFKDPLRPQAGAALVLMMT